MATTRMATRWLATAVAVMAIAAAGCSGGDGGDGSTIAVTGTDGLAFEPTSLTAEAGTVTVELTAQPAIQHTFVIEDLDDTEVAAAAAGETASGTVDLEAGDYTFYCSVPGHREAGMEGDLTVS